MAIVQCNCGIVPWSLTLHFDSICPQNQPSSSQILSIASTALAKAVEI